MKLIKDQKVMYYINVANPTLEVYTGMSYGWQNYSKKSKAVLLRAMEAHGGGMAPTHT
jgi:hypothetical protein